MDEEAAADVHADVAEPVEEEEVAGAQPPAGDAPAHSELRTRVVRQRDPEVAVDEAGEARAVDPAARRGAAVGIGNPDEVAGETDDLRLLVGDGGGVADLSVRPCGRAQGAAGAGGDAGKDDEYEQRKANAVGQRKGSLRQGRRAQGWAPRCRWLSACQQRLEPAATPLSGVLSSLERGRPLGVARGGSGGPKPLPVRVTAAPGQIREVRAR